jgi:hypothetical protein
MIERRRRSVYHKGVNRNSPRVLALVSIMAIAATVAESAQPLPMPFPETRYQTMSLRSPFAVATSTAPVAAATPGFAAQLYINGVAQSGTTNFVAIKSRDPDNHKVLWLEVGKTSDDGLKVERVAWSQQVGKSTVDVSKGGERATLVFDQDQIAAANNTVPQPVQPGFIRQPIFPGPARQMNFPPQNGQPQFGPRFFPQRPGQDNAAQPFPANMPQRRIRGMIPSGQ